MLARNIFPVTLSLVLLLAHPAFAFLDEAKLAEKLLSYFETSPASFDGIEWHTKIDKFVDMKCVRGCDSLRRAYRKDNEFENIYFGNFKVDRIEYVFFNDRFVEGDIFASKLDEKFASFPKEGRIAWDEVEVSWHTLKKDGKHSLLIRFANNDIYELRKLLSLASLSLEEDEPASSSTSFTFFSVLNALSPVVGQVTYDYYSALSCDKKTAFDYSYEEMGQFIANSKTVTVLITAYEKDTDDYKVILSGIRESHCTPKGTGGFE